MFGVGCQSDRLARYQRRWLVNLDPVNPLGRHPAEADDRARAGVV
jgi:hypothetical protein